VLLNKDSVERSLCGMKELGLHSARQIGQCGMMTIWLYTDRTVWKEDCVAIYRYESVEGGLCGCIQIGQCGKRTVWLCTDMTVWK